LTLSPQRREVINSFLMQRQIDFSHHRSCLGIAVLLLKDAHGIDLRLAAFTRSRAGAETFRMAKMIDARQAGIKSRNALSSAVQMQTACLGNGEDASKPLMFDVMAITKMTVTGAVQHAQPHRPRK
jgi:hypothetical protein